MKKHDLALLAGIILIKVLTGTAMGLFGPMLPSLAKNTNVGIELTVRKIIIHMYNILFIIYIIHAHYTCICRLGKD
jgi:hypothetical protein